MLEGKLLAVHARVDVGGDECCLNQERSRAAHGVDKVALAIPSAQLDDAGGEHLVDGGVGLRHTPSTLVERLTRRVERDGDILAIDVNVQLIVGRIETY